jgi:hypothetical protein
MSASQTHRTTINIRKNLLLQAEEAFDTSSPTVAITRALEEAVKLYQRRRLLEMDWSDLTPEALNDMRRHRSW